MSRPANYEIALRNGCPNAYHRQRRRDIDALRDSNSAWHYLEYQVNLVTFHVVDGFQFLRDINFLQFVEDTYIFFLRSADKHASW